ncbi:unnamed protein product [Thelazia callipaeda]|uniref:t-SNARE coiled-coil homology domain-containing protein n=1 Tax=Thelazia callipaeda TaxID=103827 RepID=A0A0N5D775_THECL|nr:unnamed protein product [Thelazia callipaeda]
MYSENIEYKALVSTISNNIGRLNQYVQQLEILDRKIGGTKYDERLHDQLAEVTSSANILSKETNILMKSFLELSNNQKYASSMEPHRERLTNDLIAVLNRLQLSQRSAAAKEKESMKAVAAQDQQVSHQMEQANDDEEQERQLQIQHQQHLTEIRERSEAMRKLDHDISDITQIMKDLARIVHDQGEIVDSIEANVEHASIQVQQGATAVRQAVVYQQKARQKKLILFIFLFTLFLILVLVIYFFTT